MNKHFFRIAIIAVLLGSQVVFGQSVSSNPTGGAPSATNNQLMPLTEVREGMQGTARSVFRGTEPEEFNVEILGVLPGAVGPKQDLIIGRLSGGPADRTGVFAGMSGSPVYVNGKLVGAISYSFPFSKEPICGITPIEQIVSIFEQNARQRLRSQSQDRFHLVRSFRAAPRICPDTPYRIVPERPGCRRIRC